MPRGQFIAPTNPRHLSIAHALPCATLRRRRLPLAALVENASSCVRPPPLVLAAALRSPRPAVAILETTELAATQVPAVPPTAVGVAGVELEEALPAEELPLPVVPLGLAG
jgi:hypothetical protein